MQTLMIFTYPANFTPDIKNSEVLKRFLTFVGAMVIRNFRDFKLMLYATGTA